MDATRTAALGRFSWCSSTSVSGSRAGSLASIVVSGDIGAWGTGPFRRASFATKQGAAGYCKVESLTSSEGSTSSSTTGVRCYSATGATVSIPVFAFTQVTNEASGPC